MVMVVVCPLGLPRGLLLKRTRVDAVVFEDLIHRILNDRVEIRGVTGLLGSLDGIGDGRSKLILQTGRTASSVGGRAGGTGGLGSTATGRGRLATRLSDVLERIVAQATDAVDTGHETCFFFRNRRTAHCPESNKNLSMFWLLCFGVIPEIPDMSLVLHEKVSRLPPK